MRKAVGFAVCVYSGLIFLSFGSNARASCGPPVYCARSDTATQQETSMGPPATGRMFTDPDFGSQMVRVTNSSTVSGFSGRAFHTPGSSEQNTWSVDGKKFYVLMQGGGVIPFSFNPTTMVPTRITIPGGVGVPLRPGAAFSFVNANLIYGNPVRRPLVISSFNFSTNGTSTVYDTTTCGTQPALSSTASSRDLSVSGSDQQFAAYEGGTEQDKDMFVVVYDSAQKGCRWFNTQTLKVGGQWGPAGTALVSAPTPSKPALTTQAGGKLPATTYYVKVTYVNPLGETPASSESTIKLAADHLLGVKSPAVSGNAIGYNVYVSTSSGKETKQGSTRSLGTTWTEPSGGLTSGALPLTTDTTALPFLIHNARISKSGEYVRITPVGRKFIAIWQIGTTNVVACSIDLPPYCGGHKVQGYSHSINDSGVSDEMDPWLRPISDIFQTTRLVNPLLQPYSYANQGHWSWNNANSTDSSPVCGSKYRATTPYTEIKKAWEREVVCVRTDGERSQVWRFAHNRALYNPADFWSTPRGNVSQDGKFYMFTSTWENQLGLEPGSSLHRQDVFIVALR